MVWNFLFLNYLTFDMLQHTSSEVTVITVKLKNIKNPKIKKGTGDKLQNNYKIDSTDSWHARVPPYCSRHILIWRKLSFRMVTRVACFVITINHVLNRQKNSSAEPIATVSKKLDVFLVLPFLGSEREFLNRRVKFYGFVNLRVIFNNTCKVKSFFPYKDRFSRSAKIESSVPG